MKILVIVKIIIDTGLANHRPFNLYTRAVSFHMFQVMFSLCATKALKICVDCA